MPSNNALDVEEARREDGRSRFLRLAIPVAVATLAATVAALSVPRSATAQDEERGRACSNATLRGDYGFLVSGIRGAGPGLTEAFVGTGLRTFDGHGNFTHIDSAHGQLTGAARDREAFGTYEVNANCTGTATMNIPTTTEPVLGGRRDGRKNLAATRHPSLPAATSIATTTRPVPGERKSGRKNVATAKSVAMTTREIIGGENSGPRDSTADSRRKIDRTT